MAEARRPQRHRRSVNHYSDDNPSTFTVKRKGGQALAPAPAQPSPPATIDRAAQQRAARAEGRRQRTVPSLELNARSRKGESSHSSTNGNAARGMKRKRRLQDRGGVVDDWGGGDNNSTTVPPLSAPLPADEIHAHAVSIQPVLPFVCGDPPSLSQRYPQLYRENYAGPLPATAQAQKWTRVMEAHKERWVPMLQQGNGNNISNLGNSSSGNQSGGGTPSGEQRNSLLSLPAAPWTCFAVRKDDPLYFCVGDAAGNLLLYTSQAPAVCIQTVSTSAARREAERPILWSQMQKMSSYPNSVGSVCWHMNIAVVWTRQEVEILDVVQHTTLFCLPLDIMTSSNNSKRQVFAFQSLDLHPTDSLLLWRPSGCRVLDEETDGEDHVSLYCVDFSDPRAGAKREVVVPKNNNADHFCHAAVWDRQSHGELLAVISIPQETSAGRDGGDISNDTWAYLCRMSLNGDISQQNPLPESANVSGRLAGIYTECVLEQYDDYLFLCTGRGIRCYETTRLTFLTVYGETVALHNKTVGWQGCFWIPEPFFSEKETASVSNKKKQTFWIHRADEMSQRIEASKQHLQRGEVNPPGEDSSANKNGRQPIMTNGSRYPSASTSSLVPSNPQTCSTAANRHFSNMLLVGVPHPTRGPSELQSTLYVWKPGQVLPLTTLQAPPGGLLGVHIHDTMTSGWRLTCATAKLGQGWQMGATLISDFAGTMYPVGYQLVTENTEYLEEEDELDQVVIIQPPHTEKDVSPPRNTEESELLLALKKSLETVKSSEENISVLPDDEEEKHERVFVPSIPDPCLREALEEGQSSIRSPGRRIRAGPHPLSFFPQYKDCSNFARLRREEFLQRRSTPIPAPSDAEEHSKDAFKLKGKRSRTATVEHIQQTAVDPSLRHKMGLLHKQWTTGGSSFMATEKIGTVFNENAGEPLLAQMVSETIKQQHNHLNRGVSLNTTSSPLEKPNGSTAPTGAIFEVDIVSKKLFCAACHERMVLHTCGKRELPVDSEALARAERERKAAEEEEKKRIRAEKRKIAEAKRREKKRIKKEIEDRQRYQQRMEAERLQILEEQRLAAVARGVDWDDEQPKYTQRSKASMNTIPKFSELHEKNGCNAASLQEDEQKHGFLSGEVVRKPGGDEYSARPDRGASSGETNATSTELSLALFQNNIYQRQSVGTDDSAAAGIDSSAPTDGDAMAALLGLADSIAPKHAESPVGNSQYYYAGSSDRRSAILSQLSSKGVREDDPA